MFTVKLYDSEGNEIPVKPGHAVVMGQHSMAQVPIDTYEANMVYRKPNDEKVENLRSEFGSLFNVKFPTSNGKIISWEDLNEENHDGDAGNAE